MPEDCPNFNEIAVCGDNSWIYFNQPINQIEGFSCNKPQILMHGVNCGLVWHDIDCATLVKCIKISGDEIQIEKKRVAIIKDMGDAENNPGSSGYCAPIELTSCPSGTPPTPTPTPPAPTPTPPYIEP